SIRSWVNQIWTFAKHIQLGHLIILPLKTRSAIAIGRVTGPYAYRPDLPGNARHTHKVEWIRDDLPRSDFDIDLLHSLGAFLTVCQIKRNDAEQRIRGLLEGKRIPPPVPAV